MVRPRKVVMIEQLSSIPHSRCLQPRGVFHWALDLELGPGMALSKPKFYLLMEAAGAMNATGPDAVLAKVKANPHSCSSWFHI